MSDITLHFSPLEIVLFSPMLGWPGLIIGGVIGALAWKKRRIVGGVLGAIIGNFVVAGIRVLMM